MRQCVFVIGTRAQLVKVAPVLRQAHRSGVGHTVWLTGQHDESIGDLIDDFAIQSEFVWPPQHKERSSIARLLGWFPGTLIACRRYLLSIATQTGARPVAIVHGDTLSTFLGALAAKLAGAEVVHLESGLSSGALGDPFPEEMLRRLTFRLTDIAMCPNDEAFERMQRFRRCRVVHTGENTLLDCVRLAMKSNGDHNRSAASDYFVASIHRFQNIYKQDALTRIVDEIVDLSAIARVEFILHPPTELRLRKYGLYGRLDKAPAVILRPRLPYTDFVALIGASRGVISDGGSNQEELSYLGVPTVLFRSRSERPDGLGENVVLRSETGKSLVEMARVAEFESLRRSSRIDVAAEPSQVTVETLRGIVMDNAS